MKKDLLDGVKYDKRGAYHFDKYKKNPTSVDALLKQVMQLEPNMGQTVIEIGCGEGLHVHLLRKQGYDICGVDAYPPAVKLAKKQGVENVRFAYIQDMGEGDWEGISWDVGLMFDSFEHFDRPQKAVEIITQKIRERIYIFNPSWDSEHHYDTYTTEMLVDLFKDNWDMTFEKVYHKSKTDMFKTLIQFTRRRDNA